MTNEELAMAIKAGDKTLITQLWAQVERFIAMKARAFYNAKLGLGDKPNFDTDDLIQQSYFAMLEAVDWFDSSRGTFLNALDYRLKAAFAEVAGYRLSSQRNDAAKYALSGDVPLLDDSETTLLDAVPSADIPMESIVEDAIYQQQLHDALETALAQLTTKQEMILRRRYYHEECLDQIASDLKCTSENVRQQEETALNLLHKRRKISGLDQFLDARTNFYKKKSQKQYNLDHTSVVEDLVIKRDSLARRWLQEHGLEDALNK